MQDATPITINVTEGVDRARAAVESLSPVICQRVPSGIEIQVVHTPPDSNDWKRAFASAHKGPARARSLVEERCAFLDLRQIASASGLQGLLSHEVSHILQFLLRRPLHFESWSWLVDVDHYQRMHAGVYQRMLDRIGLDLRISSDDPRIWGGVLMFVNLFWDADVHAFMFRDGVVDLATYAEIIEDFVENRIAPDRHGAIETLWRQWQQTTRTRRDLLAGLSGAVFVDWSLIVGARWAKLGPLVGQAGAEALFEKYTRLEMDMYRERLGRFLDAALLDRTWRELAACGADADAAWRIFRRLGIDSVRTVKAAMS